MIIGGNRAVKWRVQGFGKQFIRISCQIFGLISEKAI